MLRAHISKRSTNEKTGPIPVSSTCRGSCPPECPMRGSLGGCYGEYGNARLVWNKVTDGRIGSGWDEFCEAVAGLPVGQVWRHNQVGDLPGRRGIVDRTALSQLVEANRGRRGWTYTHYSPFKGDNAASIRWANKNGFTINLSADCLSHADRLADLGIAPVVVVLPHDAPSDGIFTPEGRRVLICLAERVEYMTCALCKKCLSVDRPYIVGFRSHGSCWKRVDAMTRRASVRWARVTPRGVAFQVSQGRSSLSAVAKGLGYRSTCGSTLGKIRGAMGVLALNACARACAREKELASEKNFSIDSKVHM